MATRSYTQDPVGPYGIQATTIIWSGLLNGDNGTELNCADYQDKTVYVNGTFGAGGTILFEGSVLASPGASDWFTLSDPQGNALSFTIKSGETVLEHVRWIRPRVSAGDGTTSLIAYLFLGSGARR